MTRYSKGAIILHWLMALMIIGNLAGGFLHDFVPREGGQRAQRGQPGQGGCLTHRHAEDLAAIGLEDDVLHVEGERPQPDAPEEATRPRLGDERPPGRAEARRRPLGARARGRASLLLPQGHHRSA